MNIFITGATGFIGKNFLSQLLPDIKPEDTCYLLLRKVAQFEDKRIVQLVGSLEDLIKFEKEILSCEYVFHLAANATYGSDFDYDKVNFEPTVQIVNILKNSKHLKNFIFTSTIGAVDRTKNDDCRTPLSVQSVPNPVSLYGKSKLKSEEYIIKSGIPFTIIRPAWVYGKNMRTNSHINKFVSMVYQKSFASRLNFPGKVSLIHVDDLSKALVNCLSNDRIINKIYFAETEALSIGDIFSIIYNATNTNAIVKINMPRFHFIMKRVHNRLPLTVSLLFLDYLLANDENFQGDFKLKEIKIFSENVNDVISTNINNGFWVITGANSGIGYELAKKLDAQNKKLILIDKNTGNLDSFNKHLILKVDLSNFNELVELSNAIDQHKIFCLINNAGVGFRGSLKEISVEQIKKTVDVNVCYPVFFTKLLLDKLIRDGSIIVNVASSIAYNPLPYMSIYSASKAFVSNWSESLSYELKDSNRVITISPSGTYTNFQKNAGVKVVGEGKGLLSPGYVADSIIETVYGRKDIVILGFKTRILLMISKLLPRKMNIHLWGKLFESLR